MDFHYDVNGKTVEFSISGGGFVSLEHMVEVLGIALTDTNTENGAEIATKGETGSVIENAIIQLNEVEISEATREFVADVKDVAEVNNGTTEYLIDEGESENVYAVKVRNGKSTDITLIKVDKTSQHSIGGAKFSLVRGSENVDLTQLTITAINGGATVTPENYNYNGTTIKVVTVPEGGIRIAGLADDTYTLREVAAPAGYIITDSGKTFKTENGVIKNTDNTAHANEATNIAFEVENEPGKPLPSTGGTGTASLYLFGVMLAGFAGAGLALRKKRAA